MRWGINCTIFMPLNVFIPFTKDGNWSYLNYIVYVGVKEKIILCENKINILLCKLNDKLPISLWFFTVCFVCQFGISNGFFTKTMHFLPNKSQNEFLKKSEELNLFWFSSIEVFEFI